MIVGVQNSLLLETWWCVMPAAERGMMRVFSSTPHDRVWCVVAGVDGRQLPAGRIELRCGKLAEVAQLERQRERAKEGEAGRAVSESATMALFVTASCSLIDTRRSRERCIFSRAGCSRVDQQQSPWQRSDAVEPCAGARWLLECCWCTSVSLSLLHVI